jgi:hydrogenase maturation protein HypF
MPGGEFAVKEPWRMAFSLIHDYLYYDMFDLHLECLQLKSEYFYTTLYGMLSQGINCPLTSSVGRLFDAVSSILGLCHEISFPAEAAVKLEKLATPSKESGFYEFDILEEDNCFVISYSKFLRGLLYDIDRGIPGEDIAKKFHNSLVEIIIKMIDKISSAHNTKDIVLSGGVFQNKILFAAAAKRLSEGGYNLIYDKQTPVNDLGICLGQIYVAKTCA